MIKNAKFLLVVALFWFSEYVFIPYFTPYLRGLGIAGSAAGFILGAYGFSQLALRVPFGVAANRSGNHKAFMAAGFVSLIAAGTILSLTAHPAGFFFARFLAGLASSTWVSFTVYYANMHDAAETGKAISALMIANNLGTLTSYLFGMLLFERMGIGKMFATSIAAAAAGAALLLLLTRGGKSGGNSGSSERNESGRSTVSGGSSGNSEHSGGGGDGAAAVMGFRDFGNVIKNRTMLLFSSIAALSQIITFATVMSFTPDHVKNSLGAGGRALALLSVVYSAACLSGAYWTRTKLSGRIPHKYQLACSFTLSALYCAIVPNAGSLVTVYIMQFIGGAGQASAMTLAMALALGDIRQRDRSAAMGVYQCIYSAGMTLGPVLMGRLIDVFAAFNYACYTIIAVCAAGVLLSVIAVGRNRRRGVTRT